MSKDSIPKVKKDSTKIVNKDSLLIKKKDTAKIDTIKPKEAISDLITHTAKDYTNQNAKKKTVELYNEAHLVYTDIDLKAGIIIIDYLNNTLFAKGIKDSTGYVQRPVFKQGNQESEQDSMIYNFKTKRAIIYGIKTTQDPGIYVLGEKAKRVNDSTIYMRKIKFTTSDKDKPDYYIGVDKAKVVPNKKIVAGVSNLVIADVPTPLFLPFAYFPLGKGRSSGFIIPTWSSSNSRGFFLQNGGYYFAVNDYVDLELLGDVFSNGGWGVRANSQYYVRYKFSGNVNLSFERIIESTRGFDDFSEATNFNFRWSHRQDVKASPNSNFSASVNIGSSQFFRQSLNEFNNSNFLTNTFNSSISYQKTFVGTPFNLNVNATHSQNTNTELVTMTLPSLQVSMNRIFPFAGKGGIKKNPLQNIGLTYNMQGEYRISTTEEDFLTSRMFEDAVAGVQHRADANTNLTLFNYFTLSPSINYREVWNFQSLEKNYDETFLDEDGNGVVVTDIVQGFRTFREYNTSLNLTTNIYGTWEFNNSKSRLRGIRHTIRPSISFTYRPDFADRYNLQVQRSSDPTDVEIYSPFGEGASVYGTPSAGLSSSIGISINNVLEAKVAPKDPDSDEEDRKITILNNLNFNTSYNIAADSLNWSPVQATAGTRLFKDKLALNVNATLDWYQINEAGVRINKFNPGLFRLTSANLTANYSLSSKDFEDGEDSNTPNNSGNGNQNTPDVLGQNIDPTNRFATVLVVGCWLLVVGCWLLVVGCWLLVVGCWLLITLLYKSFATL